MKYGVNLKISHASFTTSRHKSKIQTKVQCIVSHPCHSDAPLFDRETPCGCRSHKRNGAINREFPPHSARFEDQFQETMEWKGVVVWALGRTLLPCILLAFRNLSSRPAILLFHNFVVFEAEGKGDSFLQEAPNLICTLLRLPRLNSLRYIAQTIALQKFMTFTRFCIHLSLFVFEENYNPSRWHCILEIVLEEIARKNAHLNFFSPTFRIKKFKVKIKNKNFNLENYSRH